MKSAGTGVVEIFQYPGGPEPPQTLWSDLAEWRSGLKDGRIPAARSSATPADAVDTGLRREFELRLAEESRRSFEAGRELGFEQGRVAAHEAQAAAHAAEQGRRSEQLSGLLQGFVEERDRYLHAVEHEVVALALAVSARILRREAQMDPLLLTGAVRVALGQLSQSTQVRLKVPAADLDLWNETIAHLPNLTVKPTVLAGEGMRLGDCRVETEIGSVDLGIRAQLGEIEKGFFDRASRRGTEAAASVKGAARAEQEASS